MSVISELVGRLPSLRQKSVPIAQTRSESADTIVELITAVPGSPAMTSGTQGEALGGGWTVPTATVRIFCNVLVVKGLRENPPKPMDRHAASRPRHERQVVCRPAPAVNRLRRLIAAPTAVAPSTALREATDRAAEHQERAAGAQGNGGFKP